MRAILRITGLLAILLTGDKLSLPFAFIELSPAICGVHAVQLRSRTGCTAVLEGGYGRSVRRYLFDSARLQC
jgi:hypothetical protein